MVFTRASDSSPVTYPFILMTSEYDSLLEKKKKHIIYSILGKWHYNIVFKNILKFFLSEPIVELED